MGEVEHQRRLAGPVVRALPAGHLLVKPTAVKVSADGPLEIVDEAEHLIVWHSPVIVALAVGHITIQRHDRHIDEPGHGEPPFMRCRSHVPLTGAAGTWPAGLPSRTDAQCHRAACTACAARIGITSFTAASGISATSPPFNGWVSLRPSPDWPGRQRHPISIRSLPL